MPVAHASDLEIMFDFACDTVVNAVEVSGAGGEATEDARGEADALANGEEGANELSEKSEKLKDSLSALLCCFWRNASVAAAKNFGNLCGLMMYKSGCAL